MKTKVILLAILLCATASAQNRRVNPEAKIFKYSTTVEKERPELNEATKACISAYRRNPSVANYDALKHQVEANYDAVIARKVEKLNQLKAEGVRGATIRQMEEIVDEVVADRDNRVRQTMLRFTDPRMRPGARAVRGGFLPLIGVPSLEIAYAPVTNGEYALFNPAYKALQADLPATDVSYEDALLYCRWLGEKDGKSYRLPTEDEWEMAAGHMPRDADFNCDADHRLSSVEKYSATTGACGGIDFWGNCWEWTGTDRKGSLKAVKGGAWDSGRLSCRSENREEGRDPSKGYANVGFRIVRVDE